MSLVRGSKRMRAWIKLSFIVLFAIIARPAFCTIYPMPASGEDVIGGVTYDTAKSGETLADIGRRHDVGFGEMVLANASINPNQRLSSGVKVLIPTRFILPPGDRKGIVINLAELRLYYFPTNKKIVITEPVGIGREGNWKTPLGKTRITKKQIDPYWRPTANVRLEAAKNGTPIPWEFPPGPDNPLGKYVLRLGWLSYLIHGTNRPEGVGDRVSAGCIRLLPEDIELLYKLVEVGDEVHVIDEPFKAGWKGKRLFFEAHRPLKESKFRFKDNKSRIVSTILKAVNERKAIVRWTLVKRMMKQATGIPELVGLE